MPEQVNATIGSVADSVRRRVHDIELQQSGKGMTAERKDGSAWVEAVARRAAVEPAAADWVRLLMRHARTYRLAECAPGFP